MFFKKNITNKKKIDKKKLSVNWKKSELGRIYGDPRSIGECCSLRDSLEGIEIPARASLKDCTSLWEELLENLCT